MNFFPITTYSSDAPNTNNPLYATASQSQQSTPPPLTSTPTTTTIGSAAAAAPITVPPMRPKKVLPASEFAPITTSAPPQPPQMFKPNVAAANLHDYAMNQQRQRCAYVGGNNFPLNMSTHYSLYAQNQLFLRQQQLLQEKQQLLQKQQHEYAAATIAKQQLVLSAAAVANHPQDEIANSLKMFAVYSACKGNDTPPSSDDVMQEFAANGHTSDELNRYQQQQQQQQYQAASNLQAMANSNLFFPNAPQQPMNHCVDFNMNASNAYINWLCQKQLLQENAYNELWRQNFLNILPQQLIAETAYNAAAAAAAINMDYNNSNGRAKKHHFKKENYHIAVRRCVFCENNNEPAEVVKSHAVRDAQGRVLCPKLRIYICPICGASGDDAHTVKYCPQKPIVTMEDAVKAESSRLGSANNNKFYAQNLTDARIK